MTNRIDSLDFLRGIAVLGILIINIESFAYPAQFNPYLYGFDSSVDTSVRYWIYYFAQGKFFTMFVVLFGISFYLMLENKSDDQIDRYNLYTRRILVLFIFGALHAYFIWSGDILHHYAICALLLLPVRSFSKLGIGIFVLALLVIIFGNLYERANQRAMQKDAYDTAIKIEENERTEAQDRAIWRWENKLEKISTSRFEDKEAARKGSYLDMLKSNWNEIKLYKGELFFKIILFDCLMLMAIGILLYRSNIFTNYHSLSYYWPITFSMLGLGLALGYLKYQWWSFDYLNPITNPWEQFNFKVSPYIQGISYILLLNGLYQKLSIFRKIVAINNVGRMALTSYIFQSIICAMIFYGYGLGFHNELSRSELLVMIALVWFINMLFCHFWFKYSKQGPLESLWRKFSYQNP